MNLQTSDQGKVFASYSTADANVVQAICAELRRQGLSIWIDQTEIEPGDDIIERLNRALDETKLFIAFVGSKYFRQGGYTSSEFGAAFHKARAVDNWRMITVRLSPDIELPPLVAGRLYIDYTTPAETAERIVNAVRQTDTWDSPSFASSGNRVAGSEGGNRVNIKDVGDRDLELVVSSYVEAVPTLLRSPLRKITHEMLLPRGRKLHMELLRAVVANEGITLTFKDLLEKISTSQRFVAGYSKQIDEGFLGKFEVGVEIALEKAEKRLASFRADLRRELEELTECAYILPAS
jgi:hypothetical protein